MLKDKLAHKTHLQYMCLSKQGTLLATCSQKGTLIRIHSVPSLELVLTFQRSTMSNAKIHCLCFNGSGDALVSFSSTGSCHVFVLPKPNQISPNN
jgi:autophagy-related protein 18